MKHSELAHVLRAMYNISGETEFIFAGSQSILGSWYEDELPENITMSSEIDVFSLSIAEDDPIFNSISQHLGQDSQFHREYGYYVDVIGESTSVLPQSWKENLIPYTIKYKDTRVTGYCLSVTDLCVAKLLAKREHDIPFVKGLLDAHKVTPTKILAGLHDISTNRMYDGVPVADIQQRALNWLYAYVENSTKN